MEGLYGVGKEGLDVGGRCVLNPTYPWFFNAGTFQNSLEAPALLLVKWSILCTGSQPLFVLAGWWTRRNSFITCGGLIGG